MSPKTSIALALGLVLAAGCRDRGEDTSGFDDTGFIIDTADTAWDTGEPIDTGDTGDTEDTGDTGVDPALDAPEGFAFCAAGGKVVGNNYSGILCMGPMDLSGETVYGENYTWQSGPIYILAP